MSASTSTSTSDSRPGPSCGAPVVPVSCVYLVKDYKVEVCALLAGPVSREPEPPLKLLEIRSGSLDVHMEGDQNIASSLQVDSVTDFIQRLKAEGSPHHGPHLTFEIRKETARKNLYFEMVLDQDFVDKSRAILRSPHLRITGSVEVPLTEDYSGMYVFGECGTWRWADVMDHLGQSQMRDEMIVGNHLRPLPQQYQLDKIIQLEGGMKLDHCVLALIPPKIYVSLNPNLNIKLSIQLSWEHVPEPDVYAAVKLGTDSFIQALYKDEAAFKDVTIVVGNGAEVKCHRFILAAHSPVLATMLSPENGMREGQSGRLEWKENSEEGVGLLLRYLYGMELTTEEMDCAVAVELLKTAHRYELKQLERCLKGLLLWRGREWYGTDDLLELYFFARIVDGFWNLRDHTFNIMKGMPNAIRSSDSFHELGKDEARHLECKFFGYGIPPAE